MSLALQINHAERAARQRRAAIELTEILSAHRSLPTVSNAGSTLAGRVTGPVPSGEARAVFDAWCEVLSLNRRVVRPSSSGSVWLWATTRTGPVAVTLTATVLLDEEGGRR
jgi:hypothetical protein